ncbi:hypothetical protein LZ554_002008 [Drepanopeziza brunnea f. sp. 'monogermtubi']|nr:hypothetical protein LZ554_002008 [Drepanopeziza brunnea f. sp. 'monogermtubi']
MARKRFHGLKKVKIRASWSKFNLYNLSRWRPMNTSYNTFYQQKWLGKSMTRAYHGEQIREKQWQRMFSPHLNSVVPMDHRYLAENDGSELAAGRGSGKEEPLDPKNLQFGKNLIPYMHMTYAPIERRLDMAVWRALFASSARQARQFVVHGKVKVNGKKMPYPGYLLNPGDLFQVEPDSVMFATGAPKDITQRREGRILRKSSARVNMTMEKFRAQQLERKAASRAERAAKIAEAEAAGDVSISKPKPKRSNQEDNLVLRHQRLSDTTELLKQADRLQKNRRKPMSGKQKQVLRALIKKVKVYRANVFGLSIDKLEQQRREIAAEWKEARTHPGDQARRERKRERARERKKNNPPPPKPEEPEDPDKPAKPTYDERISKQRRLDAADRIARIKEQMHDPTKPYATPWRPRPYMSAFAFVPRYLEVNHKICSAVYLRDPVARPGLTEVPSPFNAETMQLAFTWYLRRR